MDTENHSSPGEAQREKLRGRSLHLEATLVGIRMLLNSDMAEMLALSEQKFRITMINMLRALLGKMDKMQEQMGNISRKMETLR